VKERPILFGSQMVRKILAGEKKVTRRVMKPQPAPEFLARGVVGIVPQWPYQDGVRWFMADGMSELVPCPYGKPGDRLWVREAWAWPGEEEVLYRADPQAEALAHKWRTDLSYPQIHWRPSIHMRRRHSRITLEITGVRAERLQQISDKEARAEGMESCTPADQFRVLWDSLNGEREGCSWASDPFVWALSFRRLDV
jgi:hypothetical protein